MVKIIIVVTATLDNFREFIAENYSNTVKVFGGVADIYDVKYIWFGIGQDIRKFIAMNIFDIIYYGNMGFLKNYRDEVAMLEYRKTRGNRNG